MTESPFAQDILRGLNSKPKRTFSKYFYDDAGSRIFQEIMAMPEYYLSNAEEEVFRIRSSEIFKALEPDGPMQLIELGAGDGAKTLHLLRAFLAETDALLTYHPVDISVEALDITSARMTHHLPDLDVQPLAGDYFGVLENLPSSPGQRLILFLGSNIGNYAPPENKKMLAHMARLMRAGDQLLLGADLKKNPNDIRAAYDDAGGITRRFNLNLWRRLNRELGADFVLDKWDFYCQYNPDTGEVRSYLVSLEEQDVHFSKLGETVSFGRYETVWTELSKKYTLEELAALGKECGLECKHHFLDKEGRYTDTLFLKL